MNKATLQEALPKWVRLERHHGQPLIMETEVVV